MAGYLKLPPIKDIFNLELKESLERSWGQASSPGLQPVRGENRRRAAIEVLPEDVLLEIFDFYRLNAMEQSLGRPWKWHRLTHVCRKWWDAVFRSPRRLGLRILCEHDAPIGSILASWPTLPLVAKLNASRKSKHIPRNVMIALRLPDRLGEIDFHVTSSMFASIVEVTQKPCRALESVRITVEDPTGPSMLAHNTFLGGSAPHLREIKLDGIALPFPAIQQVLLSTNNLVELQLFNIPNDAYFSPNDLVTGLSSLVQLKRLTIDFRSPASSPPPRMTRSLPRRTTLPSLMFLYFHGTSGYLEEFVAQIDLPACYEITIGLFNDFFFEIPQFCKFIPRLDALTSPARAIVTHNVNFVSVPFFKEREHRSENCFLQTSCRQLDWQLSFMTQITSQLSSIISSVHTLDIQSGDELPTGEDVDGIQWLELFQPFTHVTQVYVMEELVPGIAEALVAEDMTPEVLPELTSLQLGGYRRFPSVAKAAEKFITSRRLSGRIVSLTSGDEEQEQERQQEQERRQQELEREKHVKEQEKREQEPLQREQERQRLLLKEWQQEWQEWKRQQQSHTQQTPAQEWQQQERRWRRRRQQRQQSHPQQTPEPL